MPHNQNIEHNMRKDIIYRNITVALLDTLNRKVAVEQVENGRVVEHPVPVFYHFGNDENFMKHFFIDMPDDCKIPEHAEGNFEVWPKGVLKLTGIRIKTQEITNKFVRANLKKAEFDENDRKVLKAYSAYLYALPIDLQYELELHGDTMNQGLQMMQDTIEEMYKQFVFYYQHRGIRIPAQYEFQDEYNIEKEFKFDYTDDQKLKIPVGLKVETYHPIFDEDTMIFKGNRITEFRLSINTGQLPDDTDIDGSGINIDASRPGIEDIGGIGRGSMSGSGRGYVNDGGQHFTAKGKDPDMGADDGVYLNNNKNE